MFFDNIQKIYITVLQKMKCLYNIKNDQIIRKKLFTDYIYLKKITYSFFVFIFSLPKKKRENTKNLNKIYLRPYLKYKLWTYLSMYKSYDIYGFSIKSKIKSTAVWLAKIWTAQK